MRGTIPLIVTSPVNGSAIAGATVTVQNYDTSAAVVYTGRTGTGNLGTNVLTTDSNGALTSGGNELWLNAGTYKFVISGAGLTTRTLVREIVGGDGLVEITPVGAMLPFGGSAAPTGWLLCDGSLVATATYAALFAVIGHAYNGGVDPGGGNFRLPDLRQRFPLGKAAAGTGATLGGTGGVIDHAHTVASHTHTVPRHYHGKGTLAIGSGGNHGHSGTTDGRNAGHGHFTDDGTGQFLKSNVAGTALQRYTSGTAYGVSGFPTTGGETADHQHTFTIGSSGAHTHPNADLTGSVGYTSGVNADAADMTSGSATPATDANNPPYQVVNYIIRHGRQES